MISIHALREEGDFIINRFNVIRGISIHALREEGDVGGHIWIDGLMLFLSTPSVRRATHHLVILMDVLRFLSTPSVRRATRFFLERCGVDLISIHALREEGDF